MNKGDYRAFTRTVHEYYAQHGRRELPWRLPGTDGSFDPYAVLVSEIMLQQTQVSRVIPKFETFIRYFPMSAHMAQASLAEVLQLWSGLGYNRRAKFLWNAAQKIVQHYGGVVPSARDELQTLPGIGPNTAGAILAYAYNQPEVFVETNIRSVFIHHFFEGGDGVRDADIAELVRRTLPPGNAREWYWALMDYGTHLKQTHGNHARRSAGYSKQSAFAGSQRQIRGQVIRLLGNGPMLHEQLAAHIADARLQTVLAELSKEALIHKQNDRFFLGSS